MTEKSHDKSRSRRQPVGFTPRSSGLAGEYAREQGWGLNEDERRNTAKAKQNLDGGTDYDYGAHDFGDSAVETSSARPGPRQSGENHSPTRKGSHGRP